MVSLIGLVFAFLGFLLSPVGMFVWLLGLLTFVLFPLLGRLTAYKPLANLHLWFAMWLVQRGAIVVSEHNDLLFKRMSFDDLGVEEMSFGSETKQFEDPAAALSHWMGYPFALADEVHGLLFDPRHAAIGAKRHEAAEHGQMHVRATDAEYEQYKTFGWVRGVFEFPRDHELVNIAAIRAIVTGTERAEYPERVKEMYRKSRLPYGDKTALMRMLLPVITFVAVLGVIWFVDSQSGGSGGGGSSISFGLALLVAGIGPVPWRRLAVYLVRALLLALVVGLVGLLYMAFGPVLTVLVVVTFGLGWLFVPFLSLVMRPIGAVAGPVARLYMRTGFLGYDRPTFRWTPEGYELREEHDLDGAAGHRFGFMGGTIGFTHTPDESAWDTEVRDVGKLQAISEVRTDGGEDKPTGTNIPSGYTRAPSIRRAAYTGFVPTKLDGDNHYYLDSGIALSRMTDAAVGEKSLRKLLEAKDEFGMGSRGISDKVLLYASLGSGGLAATLGTLVFFL